MAVDLLDLDYNDRVTLDFVDGYNPINFYGKVTQCFYKSEFCVVNIFDRRDVLMDTVMTSRLSISKR